MSFRERFPRTWFKILFKFLSYFERLKSDIDLHFPWPKFCHILTFTVIMIIKSQVQIRCMPDVAFVRVGNALDLKVQKKRARYLVSWASIKASFLQTLCLNQIWGSVQNSLHFLYRKMIQQFLSAMVWILKYAWFSRHCVPSNAVSNLLKNRYKIERDME